MIDKKIRRQLEVIDWDFPVSQPGETKLCHWYPGTFPSQLPATLIQALSVPGEIVFDPYSGAGTTASEAIRLGRKALVVDINPIGVLASYPICALIILKRVSPAKLDLFFDFFFRLLSTQPGDLIDTVDLEKEFFSEIDALFDKYMRPTSEKLLNDIRRKEESSVVDLSKWIEKETLDQLLDLKRSVAQKCHGKFSLLFLELIISANLRALCSQTKSWGHIADNVFPKEFAKKDVPFQLRKWMKRLLNNLKRVQLENTGALKGIQYWANIHDWTSKSTVRMKPNRPVDLIITSPPYGDAIDYILAQKLSLFYFGYEEHDIQELCMKEIGARRKRLKVDSRKRWANEMTEAAIKQSQYLSGGPFVSILPHKNHGREIGIRTMAEGLGESGWKKIFEIDRSINQKKTRQSWTSIKQETICVFAK